MKMNVGIYIHIYFDMHMNILVFKIHSYIDKFLACDMLFLLCAVLW